MTSFSSRVRRASLRILDVSKIIVCCYGIHRLSVSVGTGKPLQLETTPNSRHQEVYPKVRKVPFQPFFADGRLVDYPRDFCAFLDSCPSSYHAVESAKKLLKHNGFEQISEKDSWSDSVRPGGKYFVIRNDVSGSSLIAFAVGKLWRPGNPFTMIATHVDSPCLKIKPFSEMRHAGYSLVGVETYGGGLWHTWLDRDLGVAGRAYVRTDEWRIESRLVKVDLPLLRISSLAAHFHDHNPLKLNNETHLIPIAGLGSERKQPDSFKTRDERGDDSKESTQPSKERILWQTAPATSRHIPNLVEHVATKLNMQPADIANFDLSLYDIQKATVGGTSDEFVFGRGIDNLMMTYCGLIALTQSVSAPESLSSDRTIRLLSLFDNEETGSKTGLGGGSTFLPNTLRRLSLLPDPSSIQTATSKLLPTIHEQALSRSFLISADMIHGIHPLHTGYHETNHKPLLNSGLVLYGAAGRNLTKNTPGHLLISELACRTTPSPSPAPSLPPATSFNDVVNANDPNASPTPSVQGSANPDEYTEPPKMQYFVQPNNISCGSTLGIILAPLVGVRTAEVGNAQMSMHSIREMAGSRDLENAIRVFRAFWMGFESVEGEIDVD